MVNYKNGLVYTIRTGDSLYVGSTCNFNRRKQQHKTHIFSEVNKRSNLKVYKKIRENGCEWDMKPHKEFPCENKTQLAIEEERVRIELNADLNGHACYGFDSKKYRLNNINNEVEKKRLKKHYEKNKELICEKQKEKTICECGCEVRLNGLKRHQGSAKHIKLMETQN